MLAQFSIWALDDPHLRSEMATIRGVLAEHGIEFDMGDMATTIRGDWPTINCAIAACHEALRANHSRLLINITIDDDRAD